MNVHRILPAILVVLLAGLPSCKDQATAGDRAAHAPAGVVPGSHADWCAEHEVPESKCTRCDPSLVAAYKATGDWCAEHGLPESQCVTCDPSRKMQRPAAEGDK